MDFCPFVKNILLLDSQGKRVVAKYYSDDWATKEAKESFEKAIFNKTQKTNAHSQAEITTHENNVVIFKFVQDLQFYVTGDENENEVILGSVLEGLFDVVGIILKGNVEKKDLLENLDLVLLCIDEIIDDGFILDTDANTIAEKAAGHSMNSGSPLSEQMTLSQALTAAREHLARSILR